MAGAHARDVTEADWQAQVIDESHTRPVVVDFWAPWCGPCRALGPTLERLAEAGGGEWLLAKLNTDDAQALAQRYGIRGIPAVKAFVNGEVVDEFVGVKPAPEVKAFLDGLAPSAADVAFEAARVARAAGDVDAAQAALTRALTERRDHPDALMMAAAMALEGGERGAALELLERIDLSDREARAAEIGLLQLRVRGGGNVDELRAIVEADGRDLESRWDLANALAAGGDFGGALEHLLEIVSRDRGFWDDGARKAMLEIFAVVGERSDLAEKWRRRLSMALF